ncbi:hypothetical protein YUMDRAFT_06488, partial [Streptomyces sp. OspMP-M45]
MQVPARPGHGLTLQGRELVRTEA